MTDAPDKPLGASLRQNGKHLLITTVKLEHQRRQIRNARYRAAYNRDYTQSPIRRLTIGGKGLERQLETR